MSKHAVIVRANNTTEVVELLEDTELKQLQSAVDGLVQPIELQENITMWVNEEGVLRDLPVSLMPTWLMTEFVGTRTPILGDVIFTGGSDEDGNITDLHAQALWEVQDIVKQFHEHFGEELQPY